MLRNNLSGNFLLRRLREVGIRHISRSMRVSYDIALAAHESEPYQKALQALGSDVKRDYHIVEGA